MNNDFNKILDICLARMARGDSIEACLADYPVFETDLRNLLLTARDLDKVVEFKPSSDAKRKARKRLLGDIEKGQKEPAWKVFAKFTVLAAVASVILLIVVGIVSLNTLLPGEPPTIVATIPVSQDESNFRFFVSDAPNDIGDFTSLMVTVDRVTILKKGGGDALVTFIPELNQFDLTTLIGTDSQELWHGQVPEGEYARVDIYISLVTGTLTDGSFISIKLPSSRLQISIPFVVSTGISTSFTFDITVNKTGQGSVNYVLKPQISDSGASYEKK